MYIIFKLPDSFQKTCHMAFPPILFLLLDLAVIWGEAGTVCPCYLHCWSRV